MLNQIFQIVHSCNKTLPHAYVTDYGARVYDDGHTVMETTVKLKITVFSAKTKQMVWAGATKSVDQKSGKKLVNDVSELIVGDMKNDGFL
jgi:hypothetical protein